MFHLESDNFMENKIAIFVKKIGFLINIMNIDNFIVKYFYFTNSPIFCIYYVRNIFTSNHVNCCTTITFFINECPNDNFFI